MACHVFGSFVDRFELTCLLNVCRFQSRHEDTENLAINVVDGGGKKNSTQITQRWWPMFAPLSPVTADGSTASGDEYSEDIMFY
jgi:hypothetical protein